ncbi:hypothetical protein GCM10022280_19240 [Sphingomonas swuensis]|uniref:DUF2946 domain-containing protein n=2 Tax=Sphingomonas swuensis TaxID=977800 RepID=A0ABP7T161_9SPHN
MRLLLALFAFVALALAPLGLPAEARAADDHCTEMAGMDHGRQAPDHSAPAGVKSCCTALAAALPASLAVEPRPVPKVAVMTIVLPAQQGVRREVEVPPPRG